MWWYGKKGATHAVVWGGGCHHPSSGMGRKVPSFKTNNHINLYSSVLQNICICSALSYHLPSALQVENGIAKHFQQVPNSYRSYAVCQ